MIDTLTDTLILIIQQTQDHLDILLWMVGLLWAIFLITQLEPRLLYLGIMPRHRIGLLGIFFSPLLHAHFNHLFYNTIPLVVLSDFLLINGLNYFIFVTFTITIISGFLVWCFGKSGLHIGASGLITGYWGLLISNIYQQGTLVAIIIGVTTLYVFAGIFLGIFPREKNVSWEGHFFGLLAGFLVSYLLHKYTNT